MDLMQARVALRERSLLDIVDLAIRFVAANARPYAILASWTILPAFAACWGAALAGGWIAGWLAAFTLASLLDALFVELASKLVFSQHVRVRDAIRITAAIGPRLLVVRLTQGVGLAFSLLVGGVPWLWLGSVLLFMPEVVVLERSRVGAAYGRARGLAMVRLGVVMAAVILLSVLPIGSALVADLAGREMLQSILEIRPPKSLFTEGGSALALFGFWLALPLRATARFFVYLDVRTRIEGWDIQTRFAALAARAAATTLAAFALLVMIPAGTARAAALDPTKAEAAASAARQAHDYVFCRDPEKPLSPSARALCPHAAAIPNCEGLQQACSDTPEEDPTSLKRFAHWLGAHVPAWLKDAFRALANLPGYVFLAAVGVAIALAALAALRAMRGMSREAPFGARRERRAAVARAEKPVATATTDEEVLLARADERARRGENEVALQLYLAAALRALDRRGAVHWGPDRTNGEYVRACLEAPAREPLREIVREVDHVQFGHAAATESAVLRAAARASAIVRWTPAAMLLLVTTALAALTGCSSLHTRGAGADPAGQDLFVPWLREQGMDVGPLDGALDELEATRAGRSRAVVIDAETTALDEETKTHLEAWVASGGVLVLAGAPATWPKAFGAKEGHGGSHSFEPPQLAASQKVIAHTAGDGASFTGTLALGTSMKLDPGGDEGADKRARDPADDSTADAANADDDDDDFVTVDPGTVAWLDDGSTYATVMQSGRGAVVGMASDELMTNAGIARPGNAAVLAAILANARTSRFAVAEPEDGAAPASSPMAALIHSGLGLALLQSAVAAALLFAAAGVRTVAARPVAPPARRGFVEHIVAVGALYATAGAARHALTAYTRFFEQRLRAQMPRGATDFAAFLSSRSGLPPPECANLWSRAVAATHTPGRGNAEDLRILQSLYDVHSAIVRQDS